MTPNYYGLDPRNLPPSASVRPPGSAPTASAGNDPYGSFFQQLFQPQQTAPQPQGPNIADFAKLLNPGTTQLGMSGQPLNADGTDPGSPFNNGFFKTAAQRQQVAQDHLGANPGGFYGKIGQSGPQFPDAMPQALAPGQGLNVPWATNKGASQQGPLMNFGQVLGGVVNAPGPGLNSGIFNNGTPVTTLYPNYRGSN